MNDKRSIAAENAVAAGRVAGLTDEELSKELEALGLTAKEAAALMARLDAGAAAKRTSDVRRARRGMRDDAVEHCA